MGGMQIMNSLFTSCVGLSGDICDYTLRCVTIFDITQPSRYCQADCLSLLVGATRCHSTAPARSVSAPPKMIEELIGRLKGERAPAIHLEEQHNEQ